MTLIKKKHPCHIIGHSLKLYKKKFQSEKIKIFVDLRIYDEQEIEYNKLMENENKFTLRKSISQWFKLTRIYTLEEYVCLNIIIK